MKFLKETSTFNLVENKRLLRSLRSYELFTSESENPIYTITEKGNFLKKIIRLIMGEAMASLTFEIKNEKGEIIYILKKGIGPANTAGFKLKRPEGKLIASTSNKIRFKDDSFIEILDDQKKIIFKSGLSDGRRWYPIHVYAADNVQSNWLTNTISGEEYATVSKERSIRDSGNEFTISFSAPPSEEEALMNIVNFAITADFQYDNKE